MTDNDYLELERFQLSVPGMTERKLNELADVVNDLVELAKTRNGVKTIRTNLPMLKEPMKKLYELVLDFQPAVEAAE